MSSKDKRRFTPDFSLPAIGCGGTSQIDLAAGVSDPKNKATAYTFSGVDPESNPGAGSMGTSGLSFTAQNTTSAALPATIRVIPYNGNCAGTPQDFTITVLPGTQNRQTQNSIQLAASRVNAHDMQLNWQINYEFALESIEPEKQINDAEWETIDQQGGDQHGVGSHYNVTLHDGSYLDRSGMGNETKYRLKLIHPDGRAIWSQEV